MNKSLFKTAIFISVLLVFCIVIVPAPVTAGSTDPMVQVYANSPTSPSYIPRVAGTPWYTGPYEGPVANTYVPPPGVMPVIVLQGSPYEMGYQYGLQAPAYIAVVRDAAWASALSRDTYTNIITNCSIYSQYITQELPGFDFPAFFQGMSDAMNDQGIPFSPVDPVVMLYWGGRQGPGPAEHCTAFAAYGNTTGGGSTVVGENFDYFQVPSNSYPVLLAMYPKNGYASILPSGAGRTGSNMAANEKGLVYIVTATPSQGAGDTGPGITGFLTLPYVAMTAGSVPEAEGFIVNSTRAFALNHVLVDQNGNAEVIESTRARYAIRYSGDTGNATSIIATNHYLNPVMKPSQPVWDPLQYYPSSYYRYLTAEKMIADNYGMVNYTTAATILSSMDWWDGNVWHKNDPWSTNTINRFRPDVASLYSIIAVPNEHVVSVCTGNPGMPYWGTKAAGETGTYVNFSVGKNPEMLVYTLKADADSMMWKTVRVIGNNPPDTVTTLWAECENRYWEAVFWQDRAVLEKDQTLRAVALGRSATGFSDVIAHAEKIQGMCRDGQCS